MDPKSNENGVKIEPKAMNLLSSVSVGFCTWLAHPVSNNNSRVATTVHGIPAPCSLAGLQEVAGAASRRSKT